MWTNLGYDDIEVAEYLGLTTIRQPLFETGAKGVELLLEAIDDPERPPVRVELPWKRFQRGKEIAGWFVQSVATSGIKG